jgi:hypothetical protein
VSIPLADFVDDNSFHFGGNGTFDPVPVGAGGNGQLVNVVVSVIGTSGSSVTFRTDDWAFTRQTSSVVGRVWHDVNGDGARDESEPGIGGVTIELLDAVLGSVITTQATAATGSFDFDQLVGGPYVVRIDAQTLPPGAAPTFDPDGTASAHQFALDLGCDEAVGGRDFGYALPPIASPAAPGRFEALRQNVPNPFNPRTVIEFALAEEGIATVRIYDLAGRLVRTLVRDALPAGPHRVEWDGKDELGRSVAAGVYEYRLQTDRGRWVRRMALLK